MIYTGKNFSNTDLSWIQEGDVFNFCNLKQYQQVTLPRISAFGCMLVNCILGVGSDVVDCNTCQKDYCTWLHPRYGLPVEPVDCRHVVPALTKYVEIDGVVIPELTEYVRNDILIINGGS